MKPPCEHCSILSAEDCGLVTTAEGVVVGKFSYNLRLWEVGKDGKSYEGSDRKEIQY